MGAAPARHAVPTGVAVEVDRGLYRAKAGSIGRIDMAQGVQPQPSLPDQPGLPPAQSTPRSCACWVTAASRHSASTE